MSRATNSIALGLTVLLALALPLRAEQNRRCDQATEPSLKASLAQIQNQLDKIWVRRGPDWITAYDIASTLKNPFDLKNQSSGVAAADGYAWLRDVSCAMSDGRVLGTVIVTYRAAKFRFKEGRTRWSAPMRDGVVGKFLLTSNNSEWAIKDIGMDETIFLSDGTMRLPRPEELPPNKVWPDKRCPPPKAWQGQSCEAVTPEAASH